MHQAIGAAQVDEDPELADAGDAAAADVALAQLRQEAVFLLGSPLLDGCPLGKDYAVAASVDFDDLEAEGLANPGGQAAVAGLFGAVDAPADQLRQRDEGLHTLNIDQEAAFVVAGDVTFEGGGFIVVALKQPPPLFAASAVDGDDDLPFGRLRLQDEDQDLVAYLRDLVRVRA